MSDWKHNTAQSSTTALPGDLVSYGKEWLRPFKVFPEGKFTHLSWFSNGQIPRADRHTSDSYARNGTGYFAARVNYAADEMYFQLAFTTPAAEMTCLSIELREGRMGERGALLANLSAVAVKCPIPSWVSLDWEAYAYNATIAIDVARHGAALADNGLYVVIKSKQLPDGHLRAQLQRFDTPARASLDAPAGVDESTEGAALVTVDEVNELAHIWVHYTSALDYIELTADVGRTEDGTHVVYPLEKGTTDLRRIGFFDRFNDPPQAIVCVTNKVGVWRYGNGTGSDEALAIAAALQSGAFSVRAHSAEHPLSSVEGTIGN